MSTPPLPTNGTFGSDSLSSTETGNGGRVTMELTMEVDPQPELGPSSSMALVLFSPPPSTVVNSVRKFKKSPSERLKDRFRSLPSSLAVVPVRQQSPTSTQRDSNDNMEDELNTATQQRQVLERTHQLQEEAMQYREESLAASRNLEKVKRLLEDSTTKTLHLKKRVEQLQKGNKALECQANQNRWIVRAKSANAIYKKVVLERDELRKQNEELLRSRSDVIVCQRQDAPVELQHQYDKLEKNHKELQRDHEVLQQKQDNLQVVIYQLKTSLAAAKEGREAFQKENVRLQRELDWEKDENHDDDEVEKPESGNEFRIQVPRRQYPKSKGHKARFPKTEMESFSCTCGTSFKRERSLYMHLLLVNTKNPTLRCDYEDCPMTFDHPANYQTHMEIKHNIYDGYYTSG